MTPPDDTATPRAASRDELLWLTLIVAVGVLVRLWGLATWQWEQDELYTLGDASHLVLSSRSSPGIAGRPLYYLLQHVLLSVFPPTQLFLRLPAFAFGVLGMIACWWLGRRTFGATAGLIAAMLVALSPWHLHASQFARYWSLVFLLAALAYGLLLRGIESNGRRWLLLGALALLLGLLTHPTVLFPLVGVVVALHVVPASDGLSVRWPTRRAWLNLWLPFLAAAAAFYLFVTVTGHTSALRNSGGRGFLASIRLIPAMVQWTPTEVAVLACGAVALLLTRQRQSDRQFGLMTLLGGGTGLALLLASSFFTGVYADYGIGMLPLAFVAVGGAVQRITEPLPSGLRRWAVIGTAGLLAVSAAPGVLSHMRDGSRFDYRSAYRWIEQVAPDRPVTLGIDVLRQRYAPQVEQFSLVRGSEDPLPSGFWMVISFQRYGLREGGPGLQRYIDLHCERVHAWERGRFDYRVYRVELQWCGSDPAPRGRPT